MISLILTLCLSALSQADSLILLSGEGRLDRLPQLFFTSLQESGALVKEEEEMRTLEVSALECKESDAGNLDCSFALKGKEERYAVKNKLELYGALQELHGGDAGLNLGNCTKGAGCELKLSVVTCMVNLPLSESAAGKYGCSFVTR